MRFFFFFFFSSRRRHTRLQGDWSSDVCSSDLQLRDDGAAQAEVNVRHAATGRTAGFPEIGRASCRGKSVDLGGRRILKKKRKGELALSSTLRPPAHALPLTGRVLSCQ